ncbi:MAG: LTA synthase family protein, partial [Eubacteriales bacterium]|nr:LTA synthase family protein [Eubacteriales bacterium]
MGFLPKEIKHLIQSAVIWIFVLFIVLNPFNSSFVMSLNSQEFFTSHIRDIIENLPAEKEYNTQDYSLATGTYEQQKNGELFGIAKDKNLIVIQMEAMQNMLIGRRYNGREITPNLNRLIREQGSIYFDNFYQQIGSGNTSDAEFAINNSLMGSIESFTYQLYQDNYLKGLPWILKDEGYRTAVFHGYDKTFWNRENMYPVIGFDTYISSDQLINDHIEGIGGGNIVGISDHAFFQQSVEYLKQMDAEPMPFYSFLITLSSHNPFYLPEELKGLDLLPRDKDNIVGNYLNAEHYADRCLGEFLELLKEEGLY